MIVLLKLRPLALLSRLLRVQRLSRYAKSSIRTACELNSGLSKSSSQLIRERKKKCEGLNLCWHARKRAPNQRGACSVTCVH